MLREQKISVFEADNGKEGYEILRANANSIDMVITDLEMPHMKGDELCYKIRKELGLKELPVIFLTAVPDRNVLIDLFNAGANDYLIKPFVKEELIARLKVTKELLQSLGDEVAERKRIQADLQKSRQLARAHIKAAGKVELANTVLHNVSNVLNSVTVSCAQLDNFLSRSKLSQMLLALRLLEKNRDQLATFLTEDPKGKQLPDYLNLLSSVLEEEHQQLVEENQELQKKVRLMKEIVDTQQRHAKERRAFGQVAIGEIVDEAVKVNQALALAFDIEVRKEYDPVIMVKVHEVEITHVLINLVKNAIEAMRDQRMRLLTFRGKIMGGHFVLDVVDTGEGISPENMDKMFTHGFTTKESGHGFGLPFCKDSLMEMGGDISVKSPGPGKGTTFSLQIPLATDD
jgi:signal transduction histidine kinase